MLGAVLSGRGSVVAEDRARPQPRRQQQVQRQPGPGRVPGGSSTQKVLLSGSTAVTVYRRSSGSAPGPAGLEQAS